MASESGWGWPLHPARALDPCRSRGIALAFGRWLDGRNWSDVTALNGGTFVEELEHEVDGKHFVVTLQDLRGLTPGTWLMVLADRAEREAWDHGARLPAVQAVPEATEPVSLEQGVREALRALHEPAVLGETSLAKRLGKGASPHARGLALQQTLREEIERLRDTPLGACWHRVLVAAYLEPVGKHEAAAAALSMSYSTFRRHLAAATRHLGEQLRERPRDRASVRPLPRRR